MDKDTTKITNIPKKESREWKRNESIINKSPTLKRMRDIQQGFKPSSTIRVADNSQAYKDGWDRIFGNKENKDQLIKQKAVTELNWDGDVEYPQRTNVNDRKV